MIINKRIRSLRKHLKVDQKDFCQKVGLSQSQLSRIENDKQKGVEFEAVLSIISEYNVNAQWLKGDIGYDDTPMFNKTISEIDFENTVKERDEFRTKLMKAQEELLEYKTQKIESLKHTDNVSNEG